MKEKLEYYTGVLAAMQNDYVDACENGEYYEAGMIHVVKHYLDEYINEILTEKEGE